MSHPVEKVDPVVTASRSIGDDLRKNFGNIGAFEELCRGLRKDYDAWVKQCPIGSGSRMFVTVQGFPPPRI